MHSNIQDTQKTFGHLSTQRTLDTLVFGESWKDTQVHEALGKLGHSRHFIQHTRIDPIIKNVPSSQCHKNNQRNGREIDFSNRLLDLFQVCLVTDNFPLGVPENQTSNTDVSVLHARLRNNYLKVYLVLKTVSFKLLAFPKKLPITAESDYSQLQFFNLI